MPGEVKVVHLTSVHRPFDTRIFHKECKTLAGAGYEVVLVAPHDQDEIVDRVRIRAVPKPGGRRERVTRTVRRVYQAALQEDADVYHFHDPELIPVGLLLKWRGKRVVRDVHEDLPRQVLTKHWIPKGLRSLAGRAAEVAETSSALGFDGIVAVTPAIARRFAQKRTVIVHNFPTNELTRNGTRPYTERDPVVVYVGDMTIVRGPREMVAAMSLLPESPGARLMLAGRFSPPELEVELRQMPGWGRVKFLGWQSRDGVARLLAEGRVGLVTVHPIPNYLDDSYPLKLFEYMAVGIPVIASNFPLWRRIVEGAGCGLLVDPLDPHAIARAIQWILEHPRQAEAMGKRGQEAVSAHYSWDAEARKLLELYERLTK